MSPTYAQNKEHIYNWRIAHHEHYLAKSRGYSAKRYAWKKAQRDLLKLLEAFFPAT